MGDIFQKNKIGQFKKRSISKAGEIATLLTLGTLLVLGISGYISSYFLKNTQTVKTKATGTCDCIASPLSASTGYIWYGTDCGDKLSFDCSPNATSGEQGSTAIGHDVCNANPNAAGCLGSCTRCENGLGSDGKVAKVCVYHPELEPNCSDNGCSNDDPSRSCGNYTVPDEGNYCMQYKNGQVVGRGDRCDNISKCDIAGACNSACCTVNTVSPDGKKYCDQQNGQCATGFSWGTDVAKLPPKPAWCLKPDKTINSGKLDMAGSCNQACCGSDPDCPQQFCSVPNGACKSGKSCAPSTKVIRTCVGGTSCAWTFKDSSQGYEDSDYCDAAGLDTNNLPANSKCVKCTSDAMCRSLPAPTPVSGVNKCVDPMGANQSCPRSYEECCSRGKSRKVHMDCTQSNTSGCSYWCEDGSGKRIACGEAAACVIDSKACTNPSLPLNPGTQGTQFVCNNKGVIYKKGETKCMWPTNVTLTCRGNNNDPNDIVVGSCPAGTSCDVSTSTCKSTTSGGVSAPTSVVPHAPPEDSTATSTCFDPSSPDRAACPQSYPDKAPDGSNMMVSRLCPDSGNRDPRCNYICLDASLKNQIPCWSGQSTNQIPSGNSTFMRIVVFNAAQESVIVNHIEVKLLGANDSKFNSVDTTISPQLVSEFKFNCGLIAWDINGVKVQQIRINYQYQGKNYLTPFIGASCRGVPTAVKLPIF